MTDSDVKHFVGVDVGGTFTDIVVAGTDGSLLDDSLAVDHDATKKLREQKAAA